MTDLMIERLGSKVAIGTDGRQWIVFEAILDPNSRETWDGQQWRAVGFVHSDKRTLINCIAVKDLKLSKTGQAALDRQDAKIWRWRKASEASVGSLEAPYAGGEAPEAPG